MRALFAALIGIGWIGTAQANVYTVDIDITVIEGIQFGRPVSSGSASFPQIMLAPGDALIVNATFDRPPPAARTDLPFYVGSNVFQYTNFGETALARVEYPYFEPYSTTGFSFEVDFVIRSGITAAQTAAISAPFDRASYWTQAVPEPSVWAMMLLGLTGLGFIGYRRAKRGLRLT